MTRLFLLFALLGSLFANAQVEDSARRRLPLQGAGNARDLGGYATADHHAVRWGKIYRSADISRLTVSDLELLQTRHIDNIVDLRGRAEADKAPDKLPPGSTYVLSPAGSDSTLANWMQQMQTLNSGGDSMMIAYYSNTTYLAERYKPLFRELLKMPDDESLLLHCSAGKDRTGIGAALVLYALGVPEATIVDDYLASNTYWKNQRQQMQRAMVEKMHINPRVAEDVLSVKRAYLEATFSAIRNQYGSIDRYLQQGLGLSQADLQRLRNLYLQ